MIVDFEGEPARPLAERRAKASRCATSPGMLRSLRLCRVGRPPRPEPRRRTASPTERRAAAARALAARRASGAFLEAYREVETAASTAWVPHERTRRRLLDLFLLEKAVYEIRYEAANRPGWIDMPLRGLLPCSTR